MKFKIILAILFLVFTNSYFFGQTVSDFEKKYGSEKYYKIRPHTLIKPEFDKNGQICRVVIKPDSDSLFTDKVNMNPDSNSPMFMVTLLNSAELKEIFDELMPVETRKGIGNSSIDISGFGKFFSAQFKFDNITVNSRIARYGKGVIDMKEIGENFDLFLKPSFGSPIVASITWTERTCVEN